MDNYNYGFHILTDFNKPYKTTDMSHPFYSLALAMETKSKEGIPKIL